MFTFFNIALTKIIMPIFINNNNIYVLQNTLTKVSNAYMYKQYFTSPLK